MMLRHSREHTNGCEQLENKRNPSNNLGTQATQARKRARMYNDGQ